MKGIILSGGFGSRMYPITKCVSKQLLCVYDKPMIYYPFSNLLMAGIKDILIISTPNDIHAYKNLFGDGDNLGINISYLIQDKPEGLAQSFIIAEDFIGDDDVCMILGDNIFYGNGLDKLMKNAVNNVKINKRANLFGYYVNDPERYGVITFDKNNNVTCIEEKPIIPKSNYAVVGMYFFPNSVIEIAKSIKPSKRGELEITSINNIYLDNGNLDINIMGSGFTWLDAGTPDSLLEASNFIQTIEKRQGRKVACIEEIVLNLNYIETNQFLILVEPMKNSAYGKYLYNLISE